MNANAGRRRSRGMVISGSILAGVIAVAIAFDSEPVYSPPRIALPAPVLPTPYAHPTVLRSPGPHRLPAPFHVDASWIGFALVVIAAFILLAVLWRLFRRRLRRALEPAAAVVVGSEPGPGAAAVEPPEPEHVRRGLDRALDVLSEPREPRDAIELAWIGLEEGAADSGVQRRPAETPGEFVTRVVGRVAADRDAARTLLELYLRARFSEAPVSHAEVESARRALESLRASWYEPAAGGVRR